ncbi:MAG: DUF2203 domain-containing protein [Planctomycetaceae bacterium]|jgi:hypothetical protein|nr:DUF2203 domain-containing protein [Planctomycetaceae bacterium]MBT6483677.1 DUF2203 domain-containing protein [Planctomycetaceae bacterium]MBT6496280.1 DUF2203 domain-containing protein [Planctomycetaceae bacterium]
MNAAAKKQYFTAEEANQRLPLVRVIVQDIVELYKDVHERRERLNSISQLPGASKRDEETLYSEELRQTEEELDKDIERLDAFVDELRDLGCELKDFHTGLIDFLTLVDGREAYLCWKLGEDEIAYWHELDAGFEGRQSLLEESVSGDEATEDEQ